MVWNSHNFSPVNGLKIWFRSQSFDDQTSSAVFKQADLAQSYDSRMEHMLGVKYDRRVHTIRLKHRLLNHFPNMCAQHKRCGVLLAFNEDVGDA